MIQMMIFLSGPVVAALIYLIVNLASLWKKSREFKRMTELLVLEDQLERMIQAGRALSPNDEALEQLGRNLMGNFRLDVFNQVQQVAATRSSKKKT
ncbi:uncharacterized protein LOC120455987 [Drosophila santomea]|uniref:uncharacterized protein LOC120455987 n=1 Tax=Drosophila santomea TaxID=129105 RepID=UPI0019540B2A|nr:uncharacterized protein LOC120455987 [Drosophila santomea]